MQPDRAPFLSLSLSGPPIHPSAQDVRRLAVNNHFDVKGDTRRVVPTVKATHAGLS